MAIAFVNAAAKAVSANVTSMTLGPFAATTGNGIVVFVVCNSPQDISTITDTAGNTYTLLKAHSAPTAWGVEKIYYAQNITGNASNTITITLTAQSSFAGARCQQYSGMGNADTGITFQGAASAATSVTSGSFTPTTASGIAVAFGCNSNASRTYTAGTNYTLRNSTTDFTGGEDRIDAPASSQTASITISASDTVDIVGAVIKSSGVDRQISGTLASETFTLAGGFQRDHYLVSALAGLGYTLAGPLNRDTYLTGAPSAVFSLAGDPRRPDLLIEQSGRIFDFVLLTPAVALDVTPAPIVHVWGLRVERDGRVRDPNMFYLGVAIGSAAPAPVRGPSNLNIFSIYDPGVLRFDLTPQGQGLLLDVALNTRNLSGTLRSLGFVLAGAPNTALKQLTGNAQMTFTPTGTLARDAAAVPNDGTTVWSPGADAAWVNVRDFGATGDGVTDDTTAFRNAANTRKKLFIPAANTGKFYKLTASVTVYNDVYGDGTMPQIRMTTVTGSSSGQESAYSCFYISNYRGTATVTFNGLFLYGGWDGAANGEWAHGISIQNCDNVTVKYCRIANMYGDCVWAGGYAGVACRNIIIRNNDLYCGRRCNTGTNFADGFYARDNYIFKAGTFVCALDIETDNLGTQYNHNIFIEGNEWNVATQEFNTGALNFTTWANDDHTGPATVQRSVAANNRGRWTNTLAAYYPPANPQSPNGLISSPYGYGPIIINDAPAKTGAFDNDDVTPRWTPQTHTGQYVTVTGAGAEPNWNDAAGNYVVNSALGDGTDQTAAIQAEFDAANAAGKRIILPYTAAGYVISTPLRVRRSISSVGGTGNKPLIRTTNVATGFTNQGDVLIVPTGVSGVYIKNLNLRSSYTNGDPGTEDPQLISLGGVTNITIDGCLLENSRGDSIGQREALWDSTATVTSNILIKNNRSINSHRCGVGCTWWADNWLIIDNYIDKDNAQDAGASFVSGIDIEPESTTGVTRIEIAYNQFSMNNRTVNVNRGADGKAVFRWQVPGNPAPGGNHYLHNNYGVMGTGFFGQGGTWTGTLVNDSNGEGPVWR